jgi:hypothetical protein
MYLKVLVCAVTLWILSFQIAQASLVEVVRPGPTGEGWVAVLGDLETPESVLDPLSDKTEVPRKALFYIPLAPNGYGSGRWENENFGPIIGDVSLFKSPVVDLTSAPNPVFAIPVSDPSAADNSGDGSVPGASNLSPGSFGTVSFFGGSLTGDTPGSGSGEIGGTTGGGVDIVLSGQMDPPSSVPIPGAEWLFITGLVGWLGLVNHKRWLRILSRLGLF